MLYAEAFQQCASYDHLVPDLPWDEKAIAERRKMHEERLPNPAELIARITRLHKRRQGLLAVFLDLVEWDEGNHMHGANWVLAFIDDLLDDVIRVGPADTNSKPPFRAIGDLAELIAEHWEWIDEGVLLFSKYPSVFMPTTEAPPPQLAVVPASKALAPAATSKRTAKAKSSGKRAKKAAA